MKLHRWWYILGLLQNFLVGFVTILQVPLIADCGGSADPYGTIVP